jgi:hypothetical protein
VFLVETHFVNDEELGVVIRDPASAAGSVPDAAVDDVAKGVHDSPPFFKSDQKRRESPRQFRRRQPSDHDGQ